MLCDSFDAEIELVTPVVTEACPELPLIEERKTMYGNIRERISSKRLIIDRASMKVVIEPFYLGEQGPFYSSSGFQPPRVHPLTLS